MRAVMLEVPQALLDERRARGADRWDEMWEGELHMVPPPSVEHQRVGSELFLVLGPLAKGRGLVPLYDTTGVFRAGVDDDWRCPDNTDVDPVHLSARGVEGGAALVVEIPSPNDETYRKLDWYASVVELFATCDGRMVPVEPADIQCLGVRAETVDGRLRLTWEGGSADI